MKEATPPVKNRTTDNTTQRVVDGLRARPGVWFDVSDDVNVGSLTSLYTYVGRAHTPLEVVQRNGVLYARWNAPHNTEDDHGTS